MRAGADRDERHAGRSPAICCSTGCTARRSDSCRRSIRCWPSARTKPWSRKSSPTSARRDGVPYVIPVGGSSGVGVLGYVGGTAELVEQLRAMRHRAVAVVLRQRLARHAGRADARREAVRARRTQVYGVAVSAGEPEKIERAKRIANEAAALLGLARAAGARRISSPIRTSSATATAFRRRRGSRRSRCWHEPRRSCSIPATPRRRWPR